MLKIASLETNPNFLPPDVVDLIKSPTLPEFTSHELCQYVVNSGSLQIRADVTSVFFHVLLILFIKYIFLIRAAQWRS